MSPVDRRLLRHLALAVALKLVALAALWWCFGRPTATCGDADPARVQAVAGPSTTGACP